MPKIENNILQQWIDTTIATQPNFDLNLFARIGKYTERLSATCASPYAPSTLEEGIHIATLLLELNCDQNTIAAGLAYPSVYYSETKRDDLKEAVGTAIYKLIKGANKMEAIHSIRSDSQHTLQLDNLRKMILAMADDIRIVLIKLAEQLVILMNIKDADSEQKRQIAQLTMNLYAPLANRLGIGHLKWQLEDYAFRYLQPEQYKKLSKALNMRRDDREQFIQSMIDRLNVLFVENNINHFDISGRAKHIYSIDKKIQRKRVTFEEIYDASALRVLVSDTHACYEVLSIIHATWPHIQQEFDDYITNPKPNGYQSIHTAITGDNNINVEIQIRTHQMHEDAELGVAAHWKYKEGNSTQGTYEEKIAWLREVMDWQKEVSSDEDNLAKLFDDQIYVFTPAGDIHNLTAGSTPLDFAYHIHTSIGHRCKGAKVNGKLVQLNHVLTTGDRVEILTHKDEKPSRDWLNPELGYIKTPSALAKVRVWFKKQNFKHDFARGDAIWEKAYKREGVNKSEIENVVKRFNFKTTEQLIAAIGSGNINTSSIIHQIRLLNKPKDTDTNLNPSSSRQRKPKKNTSSLNIQGVENLVTQIARCCNPIPGDEIIGYITKNSGISIHQSSCPNINNSLKTRPHRIIDVKWQDCDDHHYTVELSITANDRSGLVRDITSELANQKIAIIGLTTRIDRKENLGYIDLAIEINGQSSLQKICHKLQSIADIIHVKRKQ